MSFTFLHSVDSNIPLFDQSLEGSGLAPVAHDVRDDLLAKLNSRGGMDAETGEDVSAAVRECAEKADLVLLTCSSLSTVVDDLKSQEVAVERTDRLLAEAVLKDALAAGEGSNVAVLVAAPTTVGPTMDLFEASRQKLDASKVGLEIVVLPFVWDKFLAGDLDGYLAGLTKAIDSFLTGASDFSHIAVGQASMGPALATCQSPRASSVWTVTGATRDYLASKM